MGYMLIDNYVLADPNKISENYKNNVWWQCLNNEKHRCKNSPKSMVYYKKRSMESCPFCKGRRRKRKYY